MRLVLAGAAPHAARPTISGGFTSLAGAVPDGPTVAIHAGTATSNKARRRAGMVDPFLDSEGRLTDKKAHLLPG
jgi:hypothetical protein